jgi:hypothetical protein
MTLLVGKRVPYTLHPWQQYSKSAGQVLAAVVQPHHYDHVLESKLLASAAAHHSHRL